MRNIKSQIEQRVLPSIPDEASIQDRARAAAQAARPAQNTATPRNSMAQQWAAANPSLMSDPDTSQAVQLLSKRIHAEGLQPNDPAHFAELTKRLGAALPKSQVRGLAGQRTGQAAPVAGARTSAVQGGGTQGKRPDRVQLNAADLRLMRQYKLDPKSKSAQRHYAVEKLALERQEARRGR